MTQIASIAAITLATSGIADALGTRCALCADMSRQRLCQFIASYLLPASIALGVAASAQAQDDANTRRTPAIPNVAPNTPSGIFGGRKQLAISSDAGLYIQNTSISSVDGSTTTLQLRPALDYFVIDNLSVGGFLGIEYQSVPDGHSTTWAVGPRVGYNIPFSPRFSVWPKAGLSFTSTSQTVDVKTVTGQEAAAQPAGTSVDSTNLAVNLFVPVMFHPVEHFFLGFGPALDVDVTGDVKTTTIAGRLTIGGWL